jgi:hypothetical protein
MTINVNPDAQVIRLQFEALLRERIRNGVGVVLH